MYFYTLLKLLKVSLLSPRRTAEKGKAGEASENFLDGDGFLNRRFRPWSV